MKPTRKLTRRSFFVTVAGGVAAAGAIGFVGNDAAEAQGCTDSDTGRYADRPGYGRRCGRPRSGCTDSDTGRYADSPGHGHCRRRVYRSGCTDSDGGRYADSPGNGRCHRRSCTDSDSGSYADSPGRGRRC